MSFLLLTKSPSRDLEVLMKSEKYPSKMLKSECLTFPRTKTNASSEMLQSRRPLTKEKVFKQ